MAYKTSYELHHHFPRLAEESGFTFNTHRPRVHIDWNKIKLIDIDNVIRERKFVIIEQHLNDILDCVFESEFDVRILDEGVFKIFRLAQLAVEYQQFCRHYLDRSVYVLREEITSLAQDLDITKKQLQEREEELRKLKKRSKPSFKTPLPYGNDNIAAMILRTLSNKGENIFPSTSNADPIQYNKCSYCEKVFLNQLYLQSHIARRHAEVMETPQKEKPVINDQDNENAKLSTEIMELKTKLKDMEQAITNAKKLNTSDGIRGVENTTLVIAQRTENKKATKDAEVSTNTEEYLLNKFEQWKKQEHEKYNEEINVLRTQILETINSFKETQVSQAESNDNRIIEQLHSTIREQGAEIYTLKQELSNSKTERNKEDIEKRKANEDQIAFWTKRAETQTKQYEALLQKLNDAARDAKESRELAEKEREKANHLQSLLQQNLNLRVSETIQTSTDDVVANHVINHVNPFRNVARDKKPTKRLKQTTDRHTLENLHRKAQELLNIGSLSSSSTESSNTTIEENKVQKNAKGKSKMKINKKEDSPIRTINSKPQNKLEHPKPTIRNHISSEKNYLNEAAINKISKDKTTKNKSVTNNKIKQSISNGSPMRVVRAKLTEEVNSRLVSIGVDPLKSRLPQNIFHKHRMELQQMHEIKTKKNPSYEKIRHGILAYLDSNTSIPNKQVNGVNEYISPTKTNQTFRSLTSVISNVKSKALSLVKLNNNTTERRKSLDAEVANRAMSLLSTPPGSPSGSPLNIQSPNKKGTEIKYDNSKNHIKSNFKQSQEILAEKEKRQIIANKAKSKSISTKHLKFESEDESTESDHKPNNEAVVSETTKSIENLIKSPARRPASADTHLNNTVRKYTIDDGLFTRTQSTSDLNETKVVNINTNKKNEHINNDISSDDIDSITDTPLKKALSDENMSSIKQTKGVLKNASSMSSINKKKVLFDMDAIQMKSVSESPSQSITEKSDGNEKYELGLVNLDGEEWDISSIDNEPLNNDTKIQINTRTSPKIAELKQTIENQLARRNETPSTAIVGGVDILAGPTARVPSIGGSNTSLGSSILDDSEGVPVVNLKAFVKPKRVAEKEDSELDISEFSIDGIAIKNESF